MKTCEHEAGCSRPSRARGLCEMHYGRLKREGLGQLKRRPPARASGVRALAQEGKNTACVDCGADPWGGGMRCLPHFQRRATERRRREARSEA